MKVLHIEMGRNLYGGAQQVAYLIQGLNQRGIESFLLAPEESAIAERIGALENPVFTISYAGDLDLRLAFRVRQLVRDYDIDLVHVHSRRGADFWGGLGAKWAGVPAILSRRVDNSEGKTSIRFKYPLFGQVIAISEGIRNVLIENGLAPDKVISVRSSFVATDSQSPITRTEFLCRFELEEDSLVIATVAQLIPRKGHKILLKALADLTEKYPKMRVLFFGEGSERETIETEIKALGLSNRVKLVGFHKDLNYLIGNVDILVHPAFAEGLGVSLIQAAAASVPIVASKVGGIPEIVRHEINGLLVPAGDQPALTKAIDQLAGNADLRSEQGNLGRQIAEQEFSVGTMVEGNLHQYRKVLGL